MPVGLLQQAWLEYSTLMIDLPAAPLVRPAELSRSSARDAVWRALRRPQAAGLGKFDRHGAVGKFSRAVWPAPRL
jgi:hypothetical protein